jgi:ribosomal protein S18 acetylase RimI-like enzyme
MDKVYEIAKSHGIQKIELDYWTDNQMASDFYGKHGFAKYSEFVYKDLI